MNFRDLLTKYMNHVGNMEGVDFLCDTPFEGCSEEEHKELLKIRGEIENDYQTRRLG